MLVHSFSLLIKNEGGKPHETHSISSGQEAGRVLERVLLGGLVVPQHLVHVVGGASDRPDEEKLFGMKPTKNDSQAKKT